jgi:hypothetical protein
MKKLDQSEFCENQSDRVCVNLHYNIIMLRATFIHTIIPRSCSCRKHKRKEQARRKRKRKEVS